MEVVLRTGEREKDENVKMSWCREMLLGLLSSFFKWLFSYECGTRAWLAPCGNNFPHVCYLTKFGSYVSNGTRAITEISRKILTPRVPPLNVSQGHWNWQDRSANDFLLVIHGDRGYISYHIRDKRRFLSKVAIFTTTLFI